MKKFINKEEGIKYFKKLGYEIKEGSNWFIVKPFKNEINEKNKNSFYHTKYDKKCKICNSIFTYGRSNQKICQICKLFIECKNCKCYFNKINFTNYIFDCIENNLMIEAFCDKSCTGTNTIKKAHKALECNPEIRAKNLKKANEVLKYLYKNDLEWSKNQKIVAFNNLKKAHDYFDKNPEIRAKNLKKANEVLRKNPKIRAENAKKAYKHRKNKIKNELNNLSINIFKNSININNILNLRKNDICGAYVIKAKFKNYKGTEKENEVFDILVCKSKYVYDEIYRILRIISHPEKQDKNISNKNSWTTAKWWYIANLYYDFEFELLTDPNGVSENEALLIEAKYANDYNLSVEFKDKLNKIPNIEKHAYWSL